LDRQTSGGYHHQEREVYFLLSYYHLHPHQHHPHLIVLDIPKINPESEIEQQNL
jgi:hypothetical protein